MDDDDLFTIVILAAGVVGLVFLSKITGTYTASLASGEGEFPATPPGGLTGLIEGSFHQVFPLQLSADGAAMIQTQETGTGQPSLTAYEDPRGSGKYSIGYGHHITGHEASIIGINLNSSSRITPDQAEALFESDVSGAEATVNNSVTVALSQNQFDALVDFVYNIGAKNFQGSTLLKDLNAADYEGAAAQFAAWNKSGGQVNTALVSRREIEQSLFTAV